MIKELSDREYSVLGAGEAMLRLSAGGFGRICSPGVFEKRAGGSELNVVSGISMLGLRCGLITKLPKNEIGKFVRRSVRYSGVSDDYIVTDPSPEARLGIYYYESGAYPRQSLVSYDRQRSSFTTLTPSELDGSIYSKANVFHTSGITLALGEGIRKCVLELAEKFREGGALVSFDVNYRSTLWSEEAARECVMRLLPLLSVLFVSEETLKRMLGYKGSLADIQRALGDEYPNLEIICSTSRVAKSPKVHDFGSLIYDCNEKLHFSEPPYENIEVVDRIGSGDAFVAGALYALLKYRSIEKIARYGNAMAAMKNTVKGDMCECDLGDVERVIANHASGQNGELVR